VAFVLLHLCEGLARGRVESASDSVLVGPLGRVLPRPCKLVL